MPKLMLKELLRRLSASVCFLVQREGVCIVNASHQGLDPVPTFSFLVSGKDVRLRTYCEQVEVFHPNRSDGQKDLDFLVKEISKKQIYIIDPGVVEIDIYNHLLDFVGRLDIIFHEGRLKFSISTNNEELKSDLARLDILIQPLGVTIPKEQDLATIKPMDNFVPSHMMK
jgi:hypothetical protein